VSEALIIAAKYLAALGVVCAAFLLLSAISWERRSEMRRRACAAAPEAASHDD